MSDFNDSLDFKNMSDGEFSRVIIKRFVYLIQNSPNYIDRNIREFADITERWLDKTELKEQEDE